MTKSTNRLAATALSCFAAATLVSLIAGMHQWINAPFPGFLVLKNGVVASAGLTHWPAIADGSLFQARIVSYDGTRFSTPQKMAAYVLAKPTGHRISYVFANQEREFTNTIATRLFTPTDALLLFGVTMFSGIALISVALALMYMAPRDPASIGCSIALAIAGAFALTAVDLYGPYRFFRIHALAECFLGAGAVHMALVFPQRRSLSLRHPSLIPAAYATSTAIGITNQLLLFDPSGYTSTHLIAIAWAGFAFATMAVSQLAAFIRPSSYAARQRVLILALGTFASITPAAIVAVSSSLTGGEAPENLISWTGVFFPFAVGYAVLRTDILEIDSVLRRTVNYILITVIVGIIYATFSMIAEWLLRDSLGTSRTLSTIAISAFFTFAMLPLREKLQAWIDRIFFRATYDFQRTVEETSNQLARLIDLSQITNRITTTVQDTLNPETIDLTIIPGEVTEKSECLSVCSKNTEALEPDPGGIALAFQSHDRVVARLSLGRKLSGRYYSGLDRGLLKVLANQGAIAIENALAVERLHELNRTLERRVAERTSELASALDNLKSTQAQLVQAERLAAVGELAAGVAHEVNNPLNFARNSLRALQSLVDEVLRHIAESPNRTKQPAEAEKASSRGFASHQSQPNVAELADDIRQLVEILEAGLDRTARLVQDLRDFAAPKRFIRASFQLSTLIREAIELTGATIRQEGINVECRFDPTEPMLNGDSLAISQVILNVIKNAIDALEGSKSGRIEITVCHSFDFRELIASFRDNGPGIQPEYLPRIFEPFFSTKPPGKGTGLGLAMCRRVIRDHRGEIRIESEPHIGTTVTVCLPIEG